MTKDTGKRLQFSEINELLNKSEERYQQMIEEVEDYALILLDETGTTLSWNRGAEKIKGYAQQEIIGKRFHVFYSEADQREGLPEKLLSNANTTGKAVTEGWRVRKDGSMFWASVTLTALHGKQGEVIGFSKVTRDLTERKNAEDRLKATVEELQRKNGALAASEERYHKMVEEVQEYAIIFIDTEGIIRNWNKGAQKIKQYTEAEAVGRHFRLFYLPEDRLGKMPEILLGQAAAYGRAIHEGWRMRKDGSRFWGGITLTALHNEKGELLGYSKVARDLTEKEMAEDQLKNFAAELQRSNEALVSSEQHYHKMIAEVQDYSIILLDTRGNIQNWNSGAQTIKGYQSEEVIGKNFEIFYLPGDRETCLPQRLLDEAAANGRASHEGWRVKKGGSRFWGYTVITALHNEENEVIGYSKVTRELTEKKLAEDKLKAFVHELQQRNEELDRFAFATSHDLQEPLRKVQTFADLIKDHPEDTASLIRYIGKIITSADRMLLLIRSILDFTRISKLGTRQESVNLNDIIGGVLGDYELLIQEKSAIIEVDALPIIEGVPVQITQLFSNLLGNALKFSRDTPSIEIRGEVVAGAAISNHPEGVASDKYHHIIVKDNGIGFEPRYAQQIFSLFQRLHATHEYGGSGIGLALCKRIMDNHQGLIHAEGNPEQGATFHLYFPIAR